MGNIITAVADWFGLARADMPAGVMPPPRTDHAITLDTALGLPAVYRSINVLCTVGSQLTIDRIRQGAPVAGHSIVSAPDPWGTQRKFIKRTIINLAGTGTAFWQVLRGPGDQVVGVRVLNPFGMTWSTNQRTKIRTWHYSDEWGTRDLADADVKVLRLLEIPGHVRGLGPIQACRVSLGGALDLRQYAATWFGDDKGMGAGIPSATLSTDQRIDGAQADAYRQRWIESVGSHGIGILGQGLKFEPMLISPEDAQFIANQQFTITDVARMFGIPATYLLAEVNGNSMTYQNLEQVDLGFLRTTLMGYISEIEDGLSSLLPAGQTARFNLRDYLRPEAKTRAEINAIYLTHGVLSADEVRRDEGIAGAAPQPERTAA